MRWHPPPPIEAFRHQSGSWQIHLQWFWVTAVAQLHWENPAELYWVQKTIRRLWEGCHSLLVLLGERMELRMRPSNDTYGQWDKDLQRKHGADPSRVNCGRTLLKILFPIWVNSDRAPALVFPSFFALPSQVGGCRPFVHSGPPPTLRVCNQESRWTYVAGSPWPSSG